MHDDRISVAPRSTSDQGVTVTLPTSSDARLIRLHRQIRACRQCVHAGFIPEAHPIVRGGSEHRQMLVGQAPGARAHEVGVPWSGTSGVLLRAWFAQAGFPPESFLESWYFTSLTKCFPGKVIGGKGDRAPSAAERRLCASWLEGEIALVRPAIIVTLGKLAAEALIPATKRLPLAEIVGRAWAADLGYGEVTIIPLPHPSGVSRWRNDPANAALVDRALVQLAASVTQGTP
jgi:uracil-DNA glycosylase